MDKTLDSLVDFVHTIDFSAISHSALQRTVRHTLDTVGCGAGGCASEPAGSARDIVRGTSGTLRASVYGEPEPVLVDMASFANATANRYLDINDFGVSGHPSDMIPAVLAMTEAVGGSGRDAITGIYLAYEVATRLAEAVPADGGWDQGVYCSLGIAAGLAKVLRSSREQTAHALSLAIVPSIPLRVTRFGQLSQWKASATGHAAMTATFATRLARAGVSGPPAPFEGKDGLFERVWPDFSLDLAQAGGPAAIERASLKRHPACYWGQVPVDLATRLREELHTGQIESIRIDTCRNAWRSIGGGRGDAAQKWRPETRETADHSMPYLVSAALVDGRLSDAAFTPDRLSDPRLLALLDKTWVEERADLTARATRDNCPTEMTIRLTDGTQCSATADVPRGHPDDPMSDAEVAAKFDDLAGRVLVRAQADELRDRLWGLSDSPDLTQISGLMRAFNCR